MNAEKPELTDWKAKARGVDLGWINENSAVLEKVAETNYEEIGRGVIIVHTFEYSEEGHPYRYLTQSVVEESEEENLIQMIREYDPEKEILVVLMKSKDYSEIYKVETSK